MSAKIICAIVHANSNLQEVKRILRLNNLLDSDSTLKIKTAAQGHHSAACLNSSILAKLIPTRMRLAAGSNEELSDIIRPIEDVLHANQSTEKVCCLRAIDESVLTAGYKSPNPLVEALKEAVQSLPIDTMKRIGTSVEQLRTEFPTRFLKYQQHLLLSSSLSPHWHSILCDAQNRAASSAFLEALAQLMQVNIIAIESDVPAQAADEAENVIRHPSNILVVYGDAGPVLPPFPYHDPSEDDFANAFWTSATQFGLRQIWAPRYTMFSKGNVSEKERIIRKMPSIGTANSNGAWTAVDMFAGVGYFALPYAKAGATKVICWDINPWSIEGLRRGILANNFSVKVNKDRLSRAPVDEGIEQYRPEAAVGPFDEQFLIFNETNETSLERVYHLRPHIPPVRHVNCGMLPSSAMAWRNAVFLIDQKLGGWVHVHESCYIVNKDQTVQQVRERVQEAFHEADTATRHVQAAMMAMGHYSEAAVFAAMVGPREVVVEDVITVKNMGPGLIHLVVDIRIPGLPTSWEHN